MSARLKLLPLISLFILMLGVVILGVLAVGTQTITLDGSVNFNVTDKSLWIKSASISNDNNAEEPISDFLPGYINSNFTLKISDQINTYGAFSLHLGIINTTTSAYDVTATYSGSVSGVKVTATPSQIPASSEEITEITSSTSSTQLDIIVANPNGDNINLSDITITFTEWQPQVYDFTFTTSGDTATLTSYTGTGGDVVIPSTFSIRVVDGQTQYIEGTDYTVTAIAAGTSSSGPFYSVQSTLTSITIPGTIETIGNYAFYNCTALTEINYNATAMADFNLRNYIFGYAGQDGEGITVNIGSNVTKVPDYIFNPYYGSYAQNITTVNFAEGSLCESIGSSAFRYCSSLTSINIPEGVTSIGNYAFSDCSSLTSITIPESVTSIGMYAFSSCRGLTSITIPENVTSFGTRAFSFCAALTEINYNATNAADLTSNSDVFYSAGQDGDGITVNIGTNVERLPNQLFASYGNNTPKPNITTVNFADGSKCENIGVGAFYNCYSLTSITIPDSVTSIGGGAFYGCYALAEVYNYSSLTIPQGTSDSSVGVLGEYAKVVYNASDLSSGKPETRIQVVDNVQYYDFIALAPTSRNVTEVTLDSKATEINQHAFYYCENLTSIIIPEGVTSIGSYAFDGCLSLTSVGFRDNSQLTSIASNAFCDCTSLTTINFGENSQLTSIGQSAFYGCSSLTSITIPENVTSIDRAAFSSCSRLTSITIPASVTSIGSSVFSGCSSLASIEVEPANENYSSEDGVLFNKDKTTLVAYPVGNTSTSYSIPLSVTSIGSSAFSGCSSLTSITIPESVTSIGGSVFRDCTALIEINYNATNADNLTYNNGVFANAGQDGEGITVNIGANVTRLPNYIFCPYSNGSNSPNITTVNFAEGSVCTSIGSNAFSSCSSLTSITIPENVTSIGSYAFDGCSSLNEVTVESDDIYLDLTSQSVCGYLISYITSTGETVKVLKSMVDSVDPDFTNNTYLNNSSRFTRSVSEDGRYYVYTRN